MATIRDICTGAWRIATNQLTGDMPAEEAELLLSMLNDMMLALPADGIFVGWVEAGLNDDFPLEPQHVEGVKYMLAARYADQQSMPLTPAKASLANIGEQRLASDYKNIEELRVDPGLAFMPSQRRAWG